MCFVFLFRKNVGFALCFFMSYTTFGGRKLFLEDLYVRATHRKLGIGKLIINKVQNYAKLQGCIRLDFHVLKWNPAVQFYKDLGAINLTETGQWHFYRLHETDINKLLDN